MKSNNSNLISINKIKGVMNLVFFSRHFFLVKKYKKY